MQNKVKEIDRKWASREEELKEYVAKKLVEVMEEKEDKQERIKNVVIYNLKERDTNNLNWREQKQQDQAVCMDIFANELNVEEAQVVEAVRLGKPRPGDQEGEQKPRPLLVKLTEVHTKWEIVKKAKNLKEATKEEHKKVFVSPDLTQKERAKEKELRECLKEKRESGERGWYINKGKLMRRNFQ